MNSNITCSGCYDDRDVLRASRPSLRDSLFPIRLLAEPFLHPSSVISLYLAAAYLKLCPDSSFPAMYNAFLQTLVPKALSPESEHCLSAGRAAHQIEVH